MKIVKISVIVIILSEWYAEYEAEFWQNSTLNVLREETGTAVDLRGSSDLSSA